MNNASNIVQLLSPLVQLGLFGFVVNWLKTLLVDRVNDQEKRIQKLENFLEFSDKYLNKKGHE